MPVVLTATATGMDAVTGAMSNVTSVVGNVFTLITGNPLLATFAAAGLLVMGVGVYGAIKSAAH